MNVLYASTIHNTMCITLLCILYICVLSIPKRNDSNYDVLNFFLFLIHRLHRDDRGDMSIEINNTKHLPSAGSGAGAPPLATNLLFRLPSDARGPPFATI